MPFQPAHRLDDFPEYVFSRLAKEVIKVEHECGRPVLNFGIGAPDVAPSVLYTAKLAKLVQSSETYSYPGYGATPEFASALCNWYLRRFNVSIDETQLLPLCGAKDGIAHLPLALLNAGDKILVPDPGYPAFSEPARMVNAEPLYYSLTDANNFKIDYSEIKQKLSAKPKYMWVNFPSNPTGQVTTLAELQILVDFAHTHQLYILYDNAYAEITFGGYKAPSILQIEGAQDLAIEIGSFSKTYSFAGLRMGWIVGSAGIIASLRKVKSHMDSGLSLILQNLGAYALENPDSNWNAAMIASYKNRRDIIAGHLKSLGLRFTVPQGSLYIWAKIPNNAPDSDAYCMKLLHDKQILLAPGSAFGKNGTRYVRVSIGVDIDNIEDYF